MLFRSSLYPLVDFEALDEAYQKLLAGHIVTLYDDADQAIYYRRVAASSKVVALGPVANPDDKRAAWIVPLFYSLIALAVFLWTKPLRRDLEVLQDSATALGKQDFSTRVRPGFSPLGKPLTLWRNESSGYCSLTAS